MRILIVGPGAVGLALCYALSRNNKVFLGVAKRHLREISEGFRVVLPNGIETFVKVPVITIEPRAPRIQCFDVVIIAVKMPHLLEALEEVKDVVGIETVVLTVQNGWDPHGLAIEFFGHRAIHAILTIGARRIDGGVEVCSWGEAFLGSRLGLNKYVRKALQVFGASPIKCSLVSDIDKWIWIKLAINAAINPITALLRIPNGLLIMKELYELSHIVVEEVKEVASRCLGIEIGDEVHKLLDQVMISTSRNRSSMLQDVERGRKTEIEFINGAIVEIAKHCGAKADANYVLLQLIKGLERVLSRGALHSISDIRR